MVTSSINWLEDGGVLAVSNSTFNDLRKILHLNYERKSSIVWEIIWINLVYNSIIVNWYSKRIDWSSTLSREDLESILDDSFPDIKESTRLNGLAALINMFVESPYGKTFGFWETFKKNSETLIVKKPHETVSTIAVAYSLYRYAIIKNRFNFSVSEFYEPDQDYGIFIEFGLSKERFQNILRTLQENKLGIIQVDLVMGLDNISLRDDLNPIDVLKILFDK